MTTEQLMAELEALGEPGVKKIFLNHGAREPLFGVKVQHLKSLQQRVRKNHGLSLALFATRNSDAQYLAGLIADEKQMSADDLREWARTATWHMIRESTVAWVAAETAHGQQLAREWIEAADGDLQSVGWATWASLLSVVPNHALDLRELEQLLQRVAATLETKPDRVRYTMNGFVTAVGCYVPELTAAALQTAAALGTVTVHMGNTACKVPDATIYIEKCRQRGSIGKKRKTARC